MAIGSKTPDHRLDRQPIKERHEGTSSNNLPQQEQQNPDGQLRDRNFTLTHHISLASGEHVAVTGSINIVSYVIYSIINIRLAYTESGEILEFEAKLWGIGLNTSESVANGLAVQPERLLGECICIMKLGAGADGTAQLTFWRDDYGVLGQLNVTATGDASSDFGGSGLWNWA